MSEGGRRGPVLAICLGTDGAVRSCREVGFDRDEHSLLPGAVWDGGERHIIPGKAVAEEAVLGSFLNLFES
jgi:hypothetical protein